VESSCEFGIEQIKHSKTLLPHSQPTFYVYILHMFFHYMFRVCGVFLFFVVEGPCLSVCAVVSVCGEWSQCGLHRDHSPHTDTTAHTDKQGPSTKKYKYNYIHHKKH
jgi:hypothetical protein